MNTLTTVVVNLHHLADQVSVFIDSVRARYPFDLVTCFEPHLLGTGASTKRYGRRYATGAFLVGYADTLIKHDLRSFLTMHAEQGPVFGSLLVFHSPEPHQSGIVRMDDHGFIGGIEEKPEKPSTDLAFAGFGVLERSLLDIDCQGQDLVRDYLGRASQVPRGLYGIPCGGQVVDIGTPRRLADAERWRAE